MSFESFMVHTVTLMRAAEVTDPRGDVALDWSNTTDTVVKGWLSRPTGISEPTSAGRDPLVADRVLRLPAGTDVTGRDRVAAGGATYEPIGPAYEAPTPRGAHHVVVELREVHG